MEDAEDKNQRQKLYEEHRKQAWDDLQSSTDNFDKSILTLSAGALGLSLTFMKDIVPLEQTLWAWLLYVSWVSFGSCILLTVLSYPLGIRAQQEHLKNLPEYYLAQNVDVAKLKSWFWRFVEKFSWASAGLFSLGLICTVVFCIKNVEGSRMSENKKLQEARRPIAMTPATKESTPNDDALLRCRQPIAMTPIQPTKEAKSEAPAKPADLPKSKTKPD